MNVQFSNVKEVSECQKDRELLEKKDALIFQLEEDKKNLEKEVSQLKTDKATLEAQVVQVNADLMGFMEYYFENQL